MVRNGRLSRSFVAQRDVDAGKVRRMRTYRVVQGERTPSMPGEAAAFLVARNPDSRSRLPYLLRLPVAGERPLALAAREAWPGGKDVFCYELTEWPPDVEVLQSEPVEHCWRSGVAIHLVLRRRRSRRSMFVWTQARGRTVVFWRSRASMRGARPGVRVPHARGLDLGTLTIAVDSRERYAWRFAAYDAVIMRRELPVGDYAVVDGDRWIAAVERKRVDDLAASAGDGSLALALSELQRLTRSAIVVEGRLSDLLKAGDRGKVRSGWLLNLIAALQVQYPAVSWMFADTRPLAEGYAFRWLAACARLADPDRAAGGDARYGGPAFLDGMARRAAAAQEADQGMVWTSRAYALRFGVGRATSRNDLAILCSEGRLSAQGSRRTRRYPSVRAAHDRSDTDALPDRPQGDVGPAGGA